MVIKKKDRFLFFKPLQPQKLKNTITTLGASFIKLAQVLATRADFFSQEYLEQLKELHDQIPAMNKEDFDKVYKNSFQNEIFKSFDWVPIASASIGQVHCAYLKDETKVAVKLKRYGIKEQVIADIKIINFFNKIFKPFFSFYTKNSIDAVISEFSKMIQQEVNLSTELSNLKKFATTYKDSDIIFPLPYEEFCSSDAIVMSFEEGYRFDDKENIIKNDIDFKAIISQLVDFYTTQMLINGYFHADPHPGNILITKESKLVFLDFGMVKTVPNETRIAIIELIKAAHEQDYEGYISANKRLGTISYEAPVGELATFTAKMFEIFSNENLSSESMQELAFEVLETTRDFPFKLPSDAIYILRVSAIIEGLGTTYIENFNGIKDILPILQKNIPKALGTKDNILETLKQEIKDIPFIVRDFKTMVKKASEGNLEVELSKGQLEYISKEVKSYIKPIISGFSFMFAGFFLLMISSNYDFIATILFLFGMARVLYK
jgi:predicted unusual protein kinase regulating ubiquinone biosynthesis (AarF/ABC1/UbiB family)